jgi:hypothetical protein
MQIDCVPVDDTVITIRTCDRVIIGVPSAQGVRLIECGQDIRAPILAGAMVIDTSATVAVVGECQHIQTVIQQTTRFTEIANTDL